MHETYHMPILLLLYMYLIDTEMNQNTTQRKTQF